MINSYNSIERKFEFEKSITVGRQWMKVLEEINEVDKEIGIDNDIMYFKRGGTLNNLIMELLDIKLAVDNMLNKIERVYGSQPIKNACFDWDSKIKDYRVNKYKEVI